jgi:ABC-type histidine transport system ATPase subunit
MTKINEPSEEVRVILAEIVTILVSSTVFDCLRAYIDQFVSIIRALCMDPYSLVILEGCSAMTEFS